MKRMAALSFLFLFLAVVSAAYAHPPADIKIIYDPNTRMLTAVIVHDTSSPDSHYIKKVDIGLNGKEIIAQEISRQDNNNEQIVSYRIPNVKKGDMLSVEGYCSISGRLKETITVNAG
ncbi:MAG: hypothetical protein PHR11_04930 [Candidatus Omnitrophica bacterium]|nr:hypothetical protein [Candidatus Omnitrophota bacterium]